MPLISDRAICVRRYEYSETSQILALFTREHGLIRTIARGAHRTTKAGASKFDGGVDLLDEGEALFTDRLDKDLNTLAEWKLFDGHRAVRDAQRSLYLALYLAEIVGNVFESHDPHPNVFDRFVSTIDALATPGAEEAALALLFDLLGESGFLPVLDRCTLCDRTIASERAVYFSPARGGVVCRTCEASVPDRMQIDPRLIGIAEMVMNLPRADGRALRLPRLTRMQTDPLHAMLARHLVHNADRPFRMPRYILSRRRAIGSREVGNRTLPRPVPPRLLDENAVDQGDDRADDADPSFVHAPSPP